MIILLLVSQKKQAIYNLNSLKSKEKTYKEYPNFYLENTILTLGIPKIEEVSTNNFDIEIVDFPNDVLFNGSPITFNSISLKS